MQPGIQEKKHRKQKKGRYQNIWKQGKGRNAERESVLFSVEICRKTTVM